VCKRKLWYVARALYNKLRRQLEFELLEHKATWGCDFCDMMLILEDCKSDACKKTV